MCIAPNSNDRLDELNQQREIFQNEEANDENRRNQLLQIIIEIRQITARLMAERAREHSGVHEWKKGCCCCCKLTEKGKVLHELNDHVLVSIKMSDEMETLIRKEIDDHFEKNGDVEYKSEFLSALVVGVKMKSAKKIMEDILET